MPLDLLQEKGPSMIKVQFVVAAKEVLISLSENSGFDDMIGLHVVAYSKKTIQMCTS